MESHVPNPSDERMRLLKDLISGIFEEYFDAFPSATIREVILYLMTIESVTYASAIDIPEASYDAATSGVVDLVTALDQLLEKSESGVDVSGWGIRVELVDASKEALKEALN